MFAYHFSLLRFYLYYTTGQGVPASDFDKNIKLKQKYCWKIFADMLYCFCNVRKNIIYQGVIL